jgi:hypothetical protein
MKVIGCKPDFNVNSRVVTSRNLTFKFLSLLRDVSFTKRSMKRTGWSLVASVPCMIDVTGCGRSSTSGQSRS